MLSLGFELQFADLYERVGLHKVDAAFLRELEASDSTLQARLMAARAAPAATGAKQESQLLIDLAPHVDDFIGRLFGIRAQIAALAEQHQRLAPLYEVKRQFVQRSAAKAFTPQVARAFDGARLSAEPPRMLRQ